MRRALLLLGLTVATPARAADPEAVWTVDLGEKKARWTEVAGLAFAPNGRTLLAQTVVPVEQDDLFNRRYKFLAFDTRTHRELFRLDAGMSRVALDGPPVPAFVSGDRILTVSGDSVALRDCRDGKPVSTRPANKGLSSGWSGVWVVPDGGYFLSSTGIEGLRLVRGTLPANGQDKAGWTELRPVTLKTLKSGPFGSDVTMAAVNRAGTMAAASEEAAWEKDRVLVLYRAKAGETLELTRLAVAESPHPGHVTRLEFSPDGGLLATGGTEGTVKLWDTTRPAEAWKPRATVTGPDMGVFGIAFRPDGKVLAFGTSDKKKSNVWLVDVASGKVSRSFRAGAADGQVTAVAFSPDGKLLATGSSQGLVEVWDAERLLAGR